MHSTDLTITKKLNNIKILSIYYSIYAALYDEQQHMLIDYSKIQILLKHSRILFSGMPLDTPLPPSSVENAEKSA